MTKTNRLKRTAAAFMALVLTALCFTILLNTPTAYAEGENETKQTEDYELSGKKIGVQVGYDRRAKNGGV